MPRTLKILFHDACFDGTTSAALFAAFYRDVVAPGAAVVVEGVRHRDGDPFAGVRLDADDHACVDFRFCAEPAVRWWFDHHATAFQPPALREVFARRPQATLGYDPAAPSCAGLIARVLARGWAWQPPPHLREAVAWADRIDAARFASADEAVSLAAPAMRLAAWLGGGRTPAEMARHVGWLVERSLDEVAARPELAADVAALGAAQARARAHLARAARWAGDVVWFDLLDEPGAQPPGFLAYQLFPGARYTVGATRAPSAIKLSVGSNPWAPTPRGHDLGALCQRHGGGGHPAVGGVTLGLDEGPRGRAALAAIVAALAGPGDAA